MNNEATIYWHELSGRNIIDIPLISKEKMNELYLAVQDPNITRDQAIITISLSELSDVEKLIVAVNLGQFKKRTLIKRWIYLKFDHIFNKLKSIHIIDKTK